MFNGKIHHKLAIFNSYVKLPEGIYIFPFHDDLWDVYGILWSCILWIIMIVWFYVPENSLIYEMLWWFYDHLW